MYGCCAWDICVARCAACHQTVMTSLAAVGRGETGNSHRPRSDRQLIQAAVRQATQTGRGQTGNSYRPGSDRQLIQAGVRQATQTGRGQTGNSDRPRSDRQLIQAGVRQATQTGCGQTGYSYRPRSDRQLIQAACADRPFVFRPFLRVKWMDGGWACHWILRMLRQRCVRFYRASGPVVCSQ